MFDHISEPLKFLAARCVSKPLPVDSKFDGTLSLVFDILHEKVHWNTSHVEIVNLRHTNYKLSLLSTRSQCLQKTICSLIWNFKSCNDLAFSKLTFTSKKVDPKYGHLVTVSATKMRSSFYYRSQSTILAVQMLETAFLLLSFRKIFLFAN